MKKIYISLRWVWYNYFLVLSPEQEYFLYSVVRHHENPPNVSGDGWTELDQCFWQKLEFGESWSLSLLFLWSLSMCKSITMLPTPQSQQLQWKLVRFFMAVHSFRYNWPITACYGFMFPHINHWVNTRISFPSHFLCLHKIDFGIDSNQIIQMPGILTLAGCGFMTKIKCIT